MAQESLEQWSAIEAIKQLKYRYLRALDCHDWGLFATTLSKSCTARYDGGKYSFEGRDALIEGLREHMGSPQVLTMHQCHHPEITLLEENRASGTWYLQDLVFNRKQDWM